MNTSYNISYLTYTLSQHLIMANYFYTYMRFDTQAERKIGLPGLVFQYSLEDFFAKKTLCIETMLDSTKDGIQHYLGRRYLLDIAELSLIHI